MNLQTWGSDLWPGHCLRVLIHMNRFLQLFDFFFFLFYFWKYFSLQIKVFVFSWFSLNHWSFSALTFDLRCFPQRCEVSIWRTENSGSDPDDHMQDPDQDSFPVRLDSCCPLLDRLMKVMVKETWTHWDLNQDLTLKPSESSLIWTLWSGLCYFLQCNVRLWWIKSSLINQSMDQWADQLQVHEQLRLVDSEVRVWTKSFYCFCTNIDIRDDESSSHSRRIQHLKHRKSPSHTATIKAWSVTSDLRGSDPDQDSPLWSGVRWPWRAGCCWTWLGPSRCSREPGSPSPRSLWSYWASPRGSLCSCGGAEREGGGHLYTQLLLLWLPSPPGSTRFCHVVGESTNQQRGGNKQWIRCWGQTNQISIRYWSDWSDYKRLNTDINWGCDL